MSKSQGPLRQDGRKLPQVYPCWGQHPKAKSTGRPKQQQELRRDPFVGARQPLACKAGALQVAATTNSGQASAPSTLTGRCLGAPGCAPRAWSWSQGDRGQSTQTPSALGGEDPSKRAARQRLHPRQLLLRRACETRYASEVLKACGLEAGSERQEPMESWPWNGKLVGAAGSLLAGC